METKISPLQIDTASNLGEKFEQCTNDASIQRLTSPDLIINTCEVGKVGNSFPDIPSFKEDLFSYNDQSGFKGAKNKLICRSESHNYYSPSFSTACDIENIDNLDFGSDGLSTSKSDNQTYNIICQSQLPQFVPIGDTTPALVSLPNFSPETTDKHNTYHLQAHTIQLQNYRTQPVFPQKYLNHQTFFTIEELKSAPLIENNLYCPQKFTITSFTDDMNNVVLKDAVPMYDNCSEVMIRNIQSVSGQPFHVPSNQYSVLSGEQSFKDYSRAKEISSTTESKLVQDGFETIQIPKYKPIEILEKKVQVPVVHKIDTIVNVDKIQEVEKIVKVPYEKYVDRVVEETEIHYQDKIIEVPEYHDVTKTIKVPEVRERVKYEPKFDLRTVPKYVEVPKLQIVDKYEEYEDVEEVCKYVPQMQVIEVPKQTVKTVVVPVKKIIEKEVIKPVIKTRKVPVEKIKYVDKYETVEVIRNIPQIVDVPVPQHIPKIEYIDQPYEVEKYRDIPVPYPVKKIIKPIYYYTDEVKYIEVPVYKPYLVIHDHVNFKPLNNGEECQFSSNNSLLPNIECQGYSKIVSIKPLNVDNPSEYEDIKADQ